MPTDDPPRQEPFEALAARLYDELRRLARARMAELPPGQTLQPTSLVNEVFLRLKAEGGIAMVAPAPRRRSSSARLLRGLCLL